MRQKIKIKIYGLVVRANYDEDDAMWRAELPEYNEYLEESSIEDLRRSITKALYNKGLMS